MHSIKYITKLHLRIQPPGKFHAVYTPMKSFVTGGHFVCNNTLPKMREIRSKLKKSDSDTNADHPSLGQILRRILLKAVFIDESQTCEFYLILLDNKTDYN